MSSGELDVFRRYIKKKGLRYTPERETIVQEIFSAHDHFDVDTLYLRLRNKGADISKASIYRTIPLLIESGLIQEVFYEDGHMHYEHIYGHRHHCHLRCVECGKIVEFTEESMEALEQKLAGRFDFEISGHKLEMFGRCPACRSSEKTPRDPR